VAGQFVVEPGALSRAGARLSGVAADLASVDVRSPLAGAAGAVAGSDAAQQAARLAEQAAAAGRALGGAVEAMGAAAAATVQGYLAADSSSASRLHVLPGAR